MTTPSQNDPEFKPVDPYALARSEAKDGQIKRFYAHARVRPKDDGFVLMLDEREARTPARKPVGVPTEACGALLAAEWNAQGVIVEPASMPLTRLVNAVVDGVTFEMDAVKAEIVKYAGSDLLCYRADGPAALVELEAEAWDPVLVWARELGIGLRVASGLMHVAQPPSVAEAVARAVGAGVGTGRPAPYRMGALHVMTTLTGSAVLALAVLHGTLDEAAAWAKAHIDEDFQIARWGEDAEAATRRARRWREMQSAATLAKVVVA